MADNKDTKVFRALLDSVKAQICGFSELLSDARKSTLDSLKAQFDAVLAKFPADEAAATGVTPEQGQSLFSAITSFNSLFTLLGEQLTEARRTLAAQAAQLNSAVTAEVQRLVAAGELISKDALQTKVTEAVTAQTASGALVPKETVTQLCATATANGRTEGEKTVRDAQAAQAAQDTLINTRKGALTTAGLPLPEADVARLLGGSDADFETARKTAETRLAELTGKGIQLNADSPLRGKVWASEADYKTFLSLADSMPGLKRGAGEPFARGGTAGGPPPRFIV